MLRELLTPEIKELIETKNLRILKEILSEWEPQDIVALIHNIEENDRIVLFRVLPRELAVEVFSELDYNEQKNLLKQLSNDHIKELFLGLPPDDRTDIFEELPAKVTQRLLNILPIEERKEAMQLLGYPEDSVGRLMTPDYVAIRSYWTVMESIEHIRKHGTEAETVDIVYVVDDKWHLVDDMPLHKLVLANPLKKIEELMDKDFHSIYAFEDQEEAVNLMKKYNLTVLPVVDSQTFLLGIITIDDVIDVYEDEVTEDIHKGASVIPFEVNYTTSSVSSLFKKRVVWLMFLAVAGFLSGSVISLFEDTLGEIIMLAFFIPVLIDTGGNTATQSATIIIRALVTGDLTPKKWLNVVKKELSIGLYLGVALGFLLFSGSYFWKRDYKISVIVGLSVLVITVWSNLLGSLLPILLRKIRLDPAIISSPLLTTILDVTGLLIYFGFALLIL